MESEGHSLSDDILDVIEYVGLGLEILAVAVIVIGVIYGTGIALLNSRKARQGLIEETASNRSYRRHLGNTLILGLEILVAADIIRTVALEPTLENVAILGLLVLIRTFLSWSLTVELEGRWPWQSSSIAEDSCPPASHVE